MRYRKEKTVSEYLYLFFTEGVLEMLCGQMAHSNFHTSIQILVTSTRKNFKMVIIYQTVIKCTLDGHITSNRHNIDRYICLDQHLSQE